MKTELITEDEWYNTPPEKFFYGIVSVAVIYFIIGSLTYIWLLN